MRLANSLHESDHSYHEQIQRCTEYNLFFPQTPFLWMRKLNELSLVFALSGRWRHYFTISSEWRMKVRWFECYW